MKVKMSGGMKPFAKLAEKRRRKEALKSLGYDQHGQPLPGTRTRLYQRSQPSNMNSI